VTPGWILLDINQILPTSFILCRLALLIRSVCPVISASHQRYETIQRSLSVNFAYLVQMHNREPVNRDKQSRVQLVANVGNGLAHHVLMSIRMQAAVVLRCFNPVDALKREKGLLRTILHQEPGKIGC
jgi:hypothetical protein